MAAGVQQLTVAIVGGAETGKSTLIGRMSHSGVPTKTERLTKLRITRQIRLSDTPYHLDLVEVPGQATRSDPRLVTQIMGAQAVVVVYAVDDEGSLDTAVECVMEARDLLGPRVPLLLLGNKTDLPGRAVVFDQVSALREYYDIPGVELSAIASVTSIHRAFALLAACVAQRRSEILSAGVALADRIGLPPPGPGRASVWASHSDLLLACGWLMAHDGLDGPEYLIQLVCACVAHAAGIHPIVKKKARRKKDEGDDSDSCSSSASDDDDEDDAEEKPLLTLETLISEKTKHLFVSLPGADNEPRVGLRDLALAHGSLVDSFTPSSAVPRYPSV